MVCPWAGLEPLPYLRLLMPGGTVFPALLRSSGCADDSRLTGTAVMFVFGCSPGRVSWGIGVVCVAESVGEEISGRNCAMGVGGSAANRGFLLLDSSTT